MSFNKWGSHVIVRCFSVCAVSSPTLQEVSHVLGPGKVNKLQENKAITMKAFEVQPHISFLFSFFKFSDWSTSVRLHVVLLCPSQPDDLIFLRINLCVDTFTIKELNLRWKSEAGIVENIESVVEEYRNTRQLLVSPHYLSANTQQLFLSCLAKPNWQMLHMWTIHVDISFCHHWIVIWKCSLQYFGLHFSLLKKKNIAINTVVEKSFWTAHAFVTSKTSVSKCSLF